MQNIETFLLLAIYRIGEMCTRISPHSNAVGGSMHL